LLLCSFVGVQVGLAEAHVLRGKLQAGSGNMGGAFASFRQAQAYYGEQS
jgi:hypothetical protein